MGEEIVVHYGNGSEVMIKKEAYQKLWRLAILIGDSLESNIFGDFLYLLNRLRIFLEIRLPYVIAKNYNFFSEQENGLLKKLDEEIKSVYDNCNHQNVPYDLRQANSILSRFMSLYDTINAFFELRMYTSKRDILLKELRGCLNDEEYSLYRTLLIESGNSIEKLKSIIEICENIIIENWRQKLTNPHEYHQGENFAFICHLGGEITKGYVSASLLTDKILKTYGNRRVGFILDPSTIFNTSPEDCLIDNFCTEAILALPAHNLMILTKDTLEAQTLEQEDNYNEVCLYEFNPIGLIVLLDDEDDIFFYNIGQELKQKYPTLPLVYINIALYNQRQF